MNRIKGILALAVVTLAVACGGNELTSDQGAEPVGAPSFSIGIGTSGETIATDKDDYSPGELVTITGTGWQPGEAVRLTLTEDPDSHGPRQWDVMADSAGSFADTSFTTEAHHFGTTFTLTAAGLSSGLTAQTTFTDGTWHWVGCKSTAWDDKDNWAKSWDTCNGSVPKSGDAVATPPTSADDVEIRAGRGSPVRHPLLQTAASINKILISGSGTSAGLLTIAASGSLTTGANEFKLDESGDLITGGSIQGY